MAEISERRTEKRLRYSWPIWFAENYDSILSQGQMVDVSSGGAAFTCFADSCPLPGEHVTARFSVPRYDNTESFDLENYIRTGRICRIEELNNHVRRVAIQFSEPLPFKPGEKDESSNQQADDLSKTETFVEAVSV